MPQKLIYGSGSLDNLNHFLKIIFKINSWVDKIKQNQQKDD